MAEVGVPISLDGVAFHPVCCCVCLCYLHFAPENPEGGKMYLLVPAHPGCPGQGPQSCKMVVFVCVLPKVGWCPTEIKKLQLTGSNKYWTIDTDAVYR